MDPLLSVKNLSAGYGEKKILEDIQLDVFPGEIRVVLGISGCGKSTLMRNILQLDHPWTGSVDFMGSDLTKLDEEAFQKEMLKMGVTFQGSALLKSITVGENVALPIDQNTELSSGEKYALVVEALQHVHLPGTENLMPSELSGGMQKRVALARAIIMDPKLLLCDEPTAGLDPVTMKTIDELILELREKLNMTFIIVTHELRSIQRIADSITFLEKGKVLYDGPLQEADKSSHTSIQQFFNSGTLDAD